MEVKVAIQGKFKHLTKLQHATDGKKIAVYTKLMKNGKLVRQMDEAATLARLNETINNETWRSKQDNLDMITMVGVRIPVQGHNSMEFMMVKEFVPKAAGNIIIPPSEIVAKSGSDFDIDKLTIMMPNIALIGGVPEVIREKRLSSVRAKFERTKEIKTGERVPMSYEQQKRALSEAIRSSDMSGDAMGVALNNLEFPSVFVSIENCEVRTL